MNTLLATVYIPNFYELMQKLQEKFSKKKEITISRKGVCKDRILSGKYPEDD